MSQALIDGLKAMITPQLIAPLAAKLGESEHSVQKGLETGSAAMLSTIASRAGEAGFLGTILKLATSQAMGATASAGGGMGDAASFAGTVLGQVFGSGQSSVLDMIGRVAGLRGSSAATILSSAVPLVMGLIGQRAAGGGVGQLSNVLAAELPRLQGLLPSGWSSAAAAASPYVPTEAASGSKGWLWPVLLLAALAAGAAFWFLNQRQAPVTEVATKAVETATEASNAATDAAKPAVPALGEFFKRKLPNGVELNIPQLGIENKLIGFIENTAKPVDKTTWFDFDRLLFDSGKSTLQPSSAEQLQNIAAVLKAYPKVKMKIGGYTDNTGSKEANLKLSNDRAATVVSELTKLGVEPARLSAEGYGDQHAVADNATEEGRARNRRIALRVTEK